MPPVRVKVYGLIPLSKRVFLILQGICFSFLLSLFAAALWLQPDGDAVRAEAEPPVPMLDGTEPPGPWGAGALKILAFLIDHAAWVLIVLIAIGLIETLAIWRRFREAEREAAVMAPLLERLEQQEAIENAATDAASLDIAAPSETVAVHDVPADNLPAEEMAKDDVVKNDA
jgi:hypothetical protein